MKSLIFLLALCSVAMAQPTAHVDQAATGANNGLSWADAYTDLQIALAATTSGQIWVATGTYTPAAPGGSTAASFAMKNAVALYGGFAGTETALAQRDPIAHPTTLSGDLNGDDNTGGTQWDNSITVVTATGLGPTAVLDGFVVTASWPVGYSIGGGLSINGGSPQIGNCTFIGNEAGVGGGVSNSGGSPTITGCTFEANQADGGGGVFNGGGSTMSLVDCTFVGNTVDEMGGGVYSAGTANLTRCRFFGNYSGSAQGGGGIYSSSYSYLNMDNCLFSGNSTAGSGGAVMSYFAYGVTVTNCTISENTASYSCGGMYVLGSLSVSNSVFWGNRDGMGGLSEQDQLTGVGFSIDYTCLEGWTGGLGGTGNHGGDPLFLGALGADGIPGTIDDDTRLSAGSPCIDAADNTAVPAGLLTDLDGNARLADDPGTPDTGYGTAPIVDMGGYEFAVSSPWADLGNGLAGTYGIPSLVGEGTLLAGDPMLLSLTGALENAAAVLVIGLTEANTPLMGGVLVPALDVLIVLTTDATGTIGLGATWPAGVPSGSTLYFQTWIADAAAPANWAASNAVSGTAP